ncbi:MAG TPA: L,D-transpeptidase [Nannocystaceae bacterium]|nr:L,D-transpeptidase [Nannocystaceae bacterium]
MVCAAMASCRGASAPAAEPGDTSAPVASDTAGDANDAAASTAVPIVIATPAASAPTPASAAVAPARPTTAAEASSAVDDCVASVTALPDIAWLDRDDRRLQRDALVVVVKSTRRLAVFRDGARTHCYRVGLGFAPEGHKEVQGDGKTPEGWYRTSDKPWSTFDNAIAIHYPNAADARAGKAAGHIGRSTLDKIVRAIEDGKVPPQSTALGGAILIHGGGSAWDWTLGCVALDDPDLLELRAALPRGMRTDVLVLP